MADRSSIEFRLILTLSAIALVAVVGLLLILPYRLYERDIRRLHRKRRDWSGATFESMTPGTPAAWIKPGQVHNKIGYYRTRFARLRYRLAKKRYTLFLHTLITWQGRWYVTHLLPPLRRRAMARAAPR